jgi:hypothetical protein
MKTWLFILLMSSLWALLAWWFSCQKKTKNVRFVEEKDYSYAFKNSGVSQPEVNIKHSILRVGKSGVARPELNKNNNITIDSRLVRACFGDARKAEGCVNYELKRAPHLSRSQAVDAAIERLASDRC